MQNKEAKYPSGLISTLQEKASTIREIEENAQKILKNKGDVQEYKETLTQKAQLLTGLPQAVEPFFEDLPRDIQTEARIRLEEFAGNAQQALEVNSPFFMSMLLYPEDYRQGENNDLEEFIQYLISNH